MSKCTYIYVFWKCLRTLAAGNINIFTHFLNPIIPLK